MGLQVNNMERKQGIRLRAISREESGRIHQAALGILYRPGIRIIDAEARHLLIERGGREYNDGYIGLEADLVETALDSVPSHLKIYDRNGEKVLDTAAVAPCFCTGLNCLELLDHLTGNIRPCLLSDIGQAAKVCDGLSNVHMVGSLGYPNDVPPEQAIFSSIREVISHTAKPVVFFGHDDIESKQVWSYFAEIAGGWATFAERPFALDLIGPTSPLTIGAEACQRLLYNARQYLPTACYPGLIPGVSGPVTLAGALVQSAAESLAGIVLHQLAHAGAPILSGSGILPMDMRTGSLAYGSPEYSLVGLAAVDYFNDIGIPSWIGAGCSDAHTVDAQAAGEAGMNILAAVLSGTAFVHNLGYLSSGKTSSLEMLVLCDELAGMARRIVTGITVSEDTLAVKVIRKAVKTGAYLDDEHTLKHFRSELLVPFLFQRMDVNTWHEAGSSPMGERIRDKVMDLLGK